jgi:hypothetical protein
MKELRDLKDLAIHDVQPVIDECSTPVNSGCLLACIPEPPLSEYGTHETVSGLGFQVEVLKTLQGVPSSLRSFISSSLWTP